MSSEIVTLEEYVVGTWETADDTVVVVTSGNLSYSVTGGGGGGSSAAEDITIVDSGAYYTGTDVEAALQEIGADLAGMSGTTNLAWVAATSTVTSDTGTDATLTAVDGSNPGLMTVAMKSKLDGIEAGATADQSAAEILAALLTVDGAGSGLDADLLDGNEASAFATSGHNHTGTYQPLDSDLTTIAGLTPTNGNAIIGNGSAWISGTPTVADPPTVQIISRERYK
jgi:hypothetical protein